MAAASANTEVGDVIRLALIADWSRDLRSAPVLIHILGICTALTTKKEILAMELHDSRLANKGLVSNLLHLSNYGQTSFQQAHSDTYKISARAHEIGRPGGYVDRIIKNFSNSSPRARKRLEKVLQGLEEQATSSKNEGEMTKRKFDEWKAKTDIVQEAVAAELGQTALILQEKTKNEQEMEESFRLIQHDTLAAKKKLNNAVEAAEKAQNAAEEAYKQLLSAGDHIIGKIAICVTPGVIGLALVTICEVANAYSKVQEVREAESSLKSRSNALVTCEKQLAMIQDSIGAVKSETEKWKEICSAVQITLGELTALQCHIRVMVQYFSSLSDKIGLLSERCNAEFRQIAIEAAEEDAEGGPDEDDLEELLDQARQIKSFALVVNAMARTYADVSQNELFQGFQLISNLSNRDPLLLSDEEHLERSRGELAIYRRSAESGISKSVHESKVLLFEQCKAIFPTLTDDSPLNPGKRPIPPYISGDITAN